LHIKPPKLHNPRANATRGPKGATISFAQPPDNLDKKIANLERQSASMAWEMGQKDKGKVAVVDRLLTGSSTLFTRRLVGYHLPEKFKVLQIQSYAGTEDPVEHLEYFLVHLDLYDTPEEVACQAFTLTLTGNAQDWFRRLPPGSIDSFEGLGREFLGQFMAAQTNKKPSRYLLTLQQKGGETLKDFVARFNTKKMVVEDPTDDMVYVALY
jgi:hypothetical protein